MTVNVSSLAFLLAVVVIAGLWWRGYGTEFVYHRLRFCTGCRRDAINCSCPSPILFTPWDELSDEERDDV